MLFIFLPATTHSHPSVPVDRPHARHSRPQPDAQKEDALLISIARDGNVFFRDYRIPRSELVAQIRARVRDGAEKEAYLAVDARTKYCDTIAVLDQIRLAGIEKVTFLTEQPSR